MSAQADSSPDDFQMSIGDHLEDLRRRILLGLAGLVPAALLCLIFGKYALSILCRPLMDALQKYNLSTQIVTLQPADAFMVYIKVSLIVAAAIAGPWIVYQLWQFVRAGLYPNERRYVTRYIPLSITLLIAGMLFVYFIVLPWSLQFFIAFTTEIPLSLPHVTPAQATAPATQPVLIPALPGNPLHPRQYQIWFDTGENRLKVFVGDQVRVIPFGSENLLSTQFTLPDYIDLVLQLLLTFGIAFQLPLVVMVLARVGIVEIDTLKRWRRYVYFALSVLAAALAPGDVVTATIALLIPLIFLYELGIFLAKMGSNPQSAAAS